MSKGRSGYGIVVISVCCVYATTISAQSLEGQVGPSVPPPSYGNGGTGPTAGQVFATEAQPVPVAPAAAAAQPAPVTPSVVAMTQPVPAPQPVRAAPAPAAAVAPSQAPAEPAEPESERKPISGGTLGFGTSLSSGTTSFPLSIGNQLNFRVWLGDVVALQPSLMSTTNYSDSTKTTTYNFNPQVEALFAVYRGRTNRVNLGVGVGVASAGISKSTTTVTGAGGTSGAGGSSSTNGSTTTSSSDATKTDVYVPFELQLEQFLAPWFSLQIGAACELLHYTNTSSGSVSTYTIMSEEASTKLKLGLMFYTY